MKVENIIFDFGGVLVDWNPRYLYISHFSDESEIPETVAILYELKSKYKIYGLTNWSAETIPILCHKFPFLKSLTA